MRAGTATRAPRGLLRRLVVGELLADARTWVGAGVVAGAAAVVGAVAGCLLQSAVQVGGTRGLALYPVVGLVVVLTAVATAVVLSSVASLTVTSQQRSHALWQLIGVSPRQVRAVVLAQLLLVALAGALGGVLLAVPLVVPFCRWVLSTSEGLQQVPLVFGPAAAAAVVVVVTAVVTASGRRSARAASRTSGLLLVRDADPPPARVDRRRWAGLVLLLGVLVVLVLSAGRTPLDRVLVPLTLTGPLLSALVVLAGPLVFAPFLRAWTRVVPAEASASWFLARARAAHGTARASATTGPLVVAVALPGSLFAVTGTVRAAVGAQTGRLPPAPPVQTAVLLVGGPLLLAVVGAAATVFMSGRVRERESALVRAAGGGHGVVLLAAVWESVIHAVTATALGAGVVAVTAGVAAWAVVPAGGAAALPASGAGAVAVTAVAGLVLLLAATVPTTLLALRRGPARALSVE
ncbi:FtsX-like permease family protein [Kineococcus aurantiacus]|uniref:Putative ABC transport system permease protein n=1 Tax=Kineococcus aurantiacus TaxID=37633 RepID=A0A7Y9ARN3_9ACTN|nr:FtsX-like permease family protein [Kineococcus aurantiacus]NYD20527.1 putative ABC transport system permease protein [Kineococcus aurantiacus]